MAGLATERVRMRARCGASAAARAQIVITTISFRIIASRVVSRGGLYEMTLEYCKALASIQGTALGSKRSWSMRSRLVTLYYKQLQHAFESLRSGVS